MAKGMTERTWLITGAGGGFGKALAAAALARGDAVAVTDRDERAAAAVAATHPSRALGIGIDVTRPEQVRQGIARTLERFGRIDVLVNNAGYGLQGTVEETGDAQVRALFEVNFFGALDLIRAALPQLRKQRSAHIINVSSVGGRVSDPLIALYSASKFALEGLGEGLAAELGELGISITTVEPGSLATGFADAATVAETKIADYAPIFERMRTGIRELVGADPAALAAAVLKLVDDPQPPRRFAGGYDAYTLIETSLSAQQTELRQWRELSIAPGGVAPSAPRNPPHGHGM